MSSSDSFHKQLVPGQSVHSVDAGKAKVRLQQKIKDDTLDPDGLRHYALLLEVGMNSFRISIMDTRDSRCLWLEDYRFSSIVFTEQLLEKLAGIFEDHTLLKAGFWHSIRVSFKNQLFTLVPQPLFRRENAGEYLRFATEAIKPTDEVFYYKHPNHDLVSVFAGDSKVADWFRNAYPSRNVSFVHHTSAFMEGILQHADYVPARSLCILVEPSYLTIIVTHNKQVEYCNTFFYLSAQDFIYYVILVVNELKLSADNCRIVLYGEVAPDSAIYDNLYKYVRNISFGNKPSAIKFGFHFDDILDHRYFDVFNVYLCE